MQYHKSILLVYLKCASNVLKVYFQLYLKCTSNCTSSVLQTYLKCTSRSMLFSCFCSVREYTLPPPLKPHTVFMVLTYPATTLVCLLLYMYNQIQHLLPCIFIFCLWYPPLKTSQDHVKPMKPQWLISALLFCIKE